MYTMWGKPMAYLWFRPCMKLLTWLDQQTEEEISNINSSRLEPIISFGPVFNFVVVFHVWWEPENNKVYFEFFSNGHFVGNFFKRKLKPIVTG